MRPSASKVFISYSHYQGKWVWDRLVPVLRAGGAEVLVDRERFVVGRAILGQMDAVQDGAEIHLLVLSPEYLASTSCRYEMERAISCDPRFENGIVLPVVRVDVPLPEAIRLHDPVAAASPWRGALQPQRSLSILLS